MHRNARVTVHGDGTVRDATPAALELLELSLEQLRALPSGGLSLEQDREASAAFGAAWSEAGGGDIVGTGTVRLLGGRLIRIQYLIVPLLDGGFEVVLDRADEPVEASPRVYTTSGVLSAWRATERRLAELAPDSSDWQAARAAIDHFRAEYQRIVAEKTTTSGG